MSAHLPALYHWSPARHRRNITKRGLRPTCETAVWVRPADVAVGHHRADLPDETILTVCLGTTPQTAWALSGAISADRGDAWDLWEIEPHTDDEVHYRPHMGEWLDEVRIANPIPARRVWLVGTRIAGSRRMSADLTALP